MDEDTDSDCSTSSGYTIQPRRQLPNLKKQKEPQNRRTKHRKTNQDRSPLKSGVNSTFLVKSNKSPTTNRQTSERTFLIKEDGRTKYPNTNQDISPLKSCVNTTFLVKSSENPTTDRQTSERTSRTTKDGRTKHPNKNQGRSPLKSCLNATFVVKSSKNPTKTDRETSERTFLIKQDERSKNSSEVVSRTCRNDNICKGDAEARQELHTALVESDLNILGTRTTSARSPPPVSSCNNVSPPKSESRNGSPPGVQNGSGTIDTRTFVLCQSSVPTENMGHRSSSSHSIAQPSTSVTNATGQIEEKPGSPYEACSTGHQPTGSFAAIRPPIPQKPQNTVTGTSIDQLCKIYTKKKSAIMKGSSSTLPTTSAVVSITTSIEEMERRVQSEQNKIQKVLAMIHHVTQQYKVPPVSKDSTQPPRESGLNLSPHSDRVKNVMAMQQKEKLLEKPADPQKVNHKHDTITTNLKAASNKGLGCIDKFDGSSALITPSSQKHFEAQTESRKHSQIHHSSLAPSISQLQHCSGESSNLNFISMSSSHRVKGVRETDAHQSDQVNSNLNSIPISTSHSVKVIHQITCESDTKQSVQDNQTPTSVPEVPYMVSNAMPTKALPCPASLGEADSDSDCSLASGFGSPIRPKLPIAKKRFKRRRTNKLHVYMSRKRVQPDTLNPGVSSRPRNRKSCNISPGASGSSHKNPLSDETSQTSRRKLCEKPPAPQREKLHRQTVSDKQTKTSVPNKHRVETPPLNARSSSKSSSKKGQPLSPSRSGSSVKCSARLKESVTKQTTSEKQTKKSLPNNLVPMKGKRTNKPRISARKLLAQQQPGATPTRPGGQRVWSDQSESRKRKPSESPKVPHKRVKCGIFTDLSDMVESESLESDQDQDVFTVMQELFLDPRPATTGRHKRACKASALGGIMSHIGATWRAIVDES